MQLNSRIPIPGLTERYDVVRLQDELRGGRIRKNCTEVLPYQAVQGRPADLRKLSENRDMREPFGNAASRLRFFKIKPPQYPGKLLRDDYLKIGWGNKPNLLIPATAPDWGAPALCIETPEGLRTLTWDAENLQYTAGEFSIRFQDGTWALYGPDDEFHDFEADFNDSITCRTFPTGFRFIALTGPAIYYRVMDFDNRMDDAGAYGYTTIEGEYLDRDGVDAQ